jgi:transposase
MVYDFQPAQRAMISRKLCGLCQTRRLQRSDNFVFRGCRGDLVKVIWWDGQAACMFLKRREKWRFVWPSAKDGKVAQSPAQMSMLLEG